MKAFLLLLFVGCMLTRTCLAQADADAAKTADTYLAGVRIAEILEGRQAIRDAAWRVIKLPVLLDYTTLYEGMFETDIPGVKGYKRLLQVKVQSKAGMPLTKKYILISYKDRSLGKWKVYEFRELEATSIEHEVEAAKRDLGNTKYVKDQFNYRRYSYWLVLVGKLQEAKNALQVASDLNKRQPDSSFDEDQWKENMRIIERIMGGASR